MGRTVRLAMWSGPRNLSTAMMRSWESRPDSVVVDEPFYAYWLVATGCDYHPGREETLAQHEAEPDRVIEQLLAPLPAGCSLFYQKQMAHHLMPEIDRGWLKEVTNVFLIRDPREMITSLAEFVPEPAIEDTGLPQQVELFRETREHLGQVPVVIDSHDVLRDPGRMLEQVCSRLDIPYYESMLTWKPGMRDTDGVWAKYWYKKVADTTGFSEARPPKADLPPQLESLLARCQVLYDELAEHRLT